MFVRSVVNRIMYKVITKSYLSVSVAVNIGIKYNSKAGLLCYKRCGRACRLRCRGGFAELAEEFRGKKSKWKIQQYAAEQGKTANSVLKDYVLEKIGEKDGEQE